MPAVLAYRNIHSRLFGVCVFGLVSEVRQHLGKAVRGIGRGDHRTVARADLGVVNDYKYRDLGIVGRCICNARAYTRELVEITYLLGSTGLCGYLVAGNIAVFCTAVARNALFENVGHSF